MGGSSASFKAETGSQVALPGACSCRKRSCSVGCPRSCALETLINIRTPELDFGLQLPLRRPRASQRSGGPPSRGPDTGGRIKIRPQSLGSLGSNRLGAWPEKAQSLDSLIPCAGESCVIKNAAYHHDGKDDCNGIQW